MLGNYLGSENGNLDLLIEYAERLENGAVFKRLGFLLEEVAPENGLLIDACRDRITTGNAKLDPKLSADRLMTRWRLWLPQDWIRER
jgi:predicted transcriptional regulator of viral defense system